MAWGDPTDTTPYAGPSWDIVAQNPALQQALLAFGANMLEHAHERGTKGIGTSIMAGAGAYAAAAQKAKLARQVQAGQLNPVGPDLPNSTDPNLRRAYDDPNYKPTGETYTTGGVPGAPPLPQSPFGPGPWGTPAPGAPAASPQLPPSPFGPGPWGTPSPVPNASQLTGVPYPPPGPGGGGLPPYHGYQQPASRGLLDYSHGGPYPYPPGAQPPFGEGGDVSSGPQAQALSARTGVPLGANLSDLSNVQLTSDAADEGFRTKMGGSEDASGTAIQWTNGQPYIGKYQMGMPRLKDLGFADKDGNMTIPGHPEIRTIQDFAKSAQAQEQVATSHFAKVDEEIKSAGLDKYIGRTVGGVPVDQNALRGMIHIGGPNGTRRFLESDGRENPSDRFGTRIGDYGRKFAGSTGQATLQGGAGQDVAQPATPVTGKDEAAIRLDALAPDWKRQGLLADAANEDVGGLYTPAGNLSESAKHTLRLALDAGGPEGFQQALMGLAQQKPESFGNAETGLYMRYPNGKVVQVSAPKAQPRFIQIGADQPDLLRKAGLQPPPPGKAYKYNVTDGSYELTGDKPEETYTNLGAEPGPDPKTGKTPPKAPPGFTWQQHSNGQLSLVGQTPGEQWNTLGTDKGVTYLKEATTNKLMTVGTKEHQFTTLTPDQAKAALPDSYRPGMTVQQDEENRKYITEGQETYQTMTPDEAKAEYGAAFDPKAIYYKSLTTGKPAKLGGIEMKQDVPGGQVGLDYLRRNAGEALLKGTEAVSKGRQAFDFFSPNYQMLKTSALTNASTSGVGQPYVEYGKSWVNWIGSKFGYEGIAGQNNAEVLKSAIAKMMQEVKPEGAGIISDFEDRKFLDYLPGIEKSPMANYIIAESMRRMTERNAWYQSQKSKYFMGQEDPNNPKEARGHFEGFDDWLYQKDASGHRPIDDKPAMFYTWDQMKAMTPEQKRANLVEGTPYLNKDNQWDIVGRKPVQ